MRSSRLTSMGRETRRTGRRRSDTLAGSACVCGGCSTPGTGDHSMGRQEPLLGLGGDGARRVPLRAKVVARFVDLGQFGGSYP